MTELSTKVLLSFFPHEKMFLPFFSSLQTDANLLHGKIEFYISIIEENQTTNLSSLKLFFPFFYVGLLHISNTVLELVYPFIRSFVQKKLIIFKLFTTKLYIFPVWILVKLAEITTDTCFFIHSLLYEHKIN